MSDNEQGQNQEHPDLSQLLRKPVEADEAPAAPAAAVEPPPAPRAAFSEKHTPQNTPMQDFVEPKSCIIRELDESEKAKGYLPIFLGNSKAINEQSTLLLQKWLAKSALAGMHKDGDASDSMLAVARAEWTSYLEEVHPGKTSEEMDELATNLYRYMSEFQDSIKVRSKVMNEDGITNQSNRGSNFVTSDIVGKKPSAATKGFSVSEVMRRSSLRAENGEFQFDVLLRDSYTLLTFIRPNKLELASLVNDINRTVKGYVRTVGGNSVSLSYIAAARVVWDFLAARIVSSSVTGIVDFKDLARVVRFTDIGTICMALLRSTHTKGINLDLRCLNDLCDWKGLSLVDPDHLVKVRKSIETPEDSAIYANVFNGNVKYSIEETLDMIDKATYGLPSNRVYNEDKSIYLEIAPPSLAEAFETFEYYAGRINPQLAEIRSKVVDQREYETQVGVLLTTLGSTEFLHWIKTFVSVAKVGTDDEDTVLKRSECEASEFNKGLMEVILDSRVFNVNFSAFILNKTPFMSHTFVGVRNYDCPKCKTNSHDAQHADRKLGYTPIEPLVAFFTLTQLMQISHAADAADATKEAISEEI